MRWSLALGTLAAALVVGATAIADNVDADGDGVAPVASNDMSFGNVDCGVPTDKTALIAISRNGNYATSNVFLKGSTVTVSVVSVTGSGLSAVMNAPTTITIPSNWDTAPNNTLTASVSSKVTVNSSTPGSGSGSVLYRATGTKSDGTTPFSRDDTMSVSWTVLNNCAPVNEDPTADAGGAYNGAEGATISLDGTGSSDDGSIASYAWTVTPQSGGPDAGASCSFVGGTSSTDSQPKVACTDDGTYDVSLTVTDDDGASDSDSTTLALTNENPSATPSIPSSVNEGSAINLSLGSASDPGTNDVLTYQFDCGDGAGYNAASATASRSCPTTDNGSRSVKLKILDDDGGFAEYTGTVAVNNVAPSATFAATSPISEGGSSSLSLTGASDPSSADTTAGFKYSFACDGLAASLATTYAGAGSTSTASCPFDDNGSFPVKARIFDKDSGFNTYDATVVVDNVAPVLTAITAPSQGALYPVNATVNLSATFTDAGAADTHTCHVDWDAGGMFSTAGTSVSESSGSGTCNASRSYSSAGVYTIKVKVRDDDGAFSNVLEVMVVVFDPSAGFVTGGGWINSPAGAYAADASLTGKANFGFVSKYKKGATVPEGQTEFQLHFASFNFQSTSYQWLVVSANGTKAQYKGNGTVNGNGSYGFLLTAYDEPDKFRIKIWNTATSAVVYDNRAGPSEDIDAADPQAIAGGSIVIHTPKK